MSSYELEKASDEERARLSYQYDIQVKKNCIMVTPSSPSLPNLSGLEIQFRQ